MGIHSLKGLKSKINY